MAAAAEAALHRLPPGVARGAAARGGRGEGARRLGAAAGGLRSIDDASGHFLGPSPGLLSSMRSPLWSSSSASPSPRRRLTAGNATIIIESTKGRSSSSSSPGLSPSSPPPVVGFEQLASSAPPAASSSSRYALFESPCVVSAGKRLLPPLFHQRRCLGNEARARRSLTLADHSGLALKLLPGQPPATSYASFKQRCESLRLLLFLSVSGTLGIDLLLNPPRSSYWTQRLSLLRLPGALLRSVFAQRDSVLRFSGQNVFVAPPSSSTPAATGGEGGGGRGDDSKDGNNALGTGKSNIISGSLGRQSPVVETEAFGVYKRLL